MIESFTATCIFALFIANAVCALLNFRHGVQLRHGYDELHEHERELNELENWLDKKYRMIDNS